MVLGGVFDKATDFLGDAVGTLPGGSTIGDVVSGITPAQAAQFNPIVGMLMTGLEQVDNGAFVESTDPNGLLNSFVTNNITQDDRSILGSVFDAIEGIDSTSVFGNMTDLLGQTSRGLSNNPFVPLWGSPLSGPRNTAAGLLVNGAGSVTNRGLIE